MSDLTPSQMQSYRIPSKLFSEFCDHSHSSCAPNSISPNASELEWHACIIDGGTSDSGSDDDDDPAFQVSSSALPKDYTRHT